MGTDFRVVREVDIREMLEMKALDECSVRES